MIYYRYLFKNDWGLSPNEGLVYSALLANSLRIPEHYDAEGNFCKEFVRAFIMDNVETVGKQCVDYNPVSTRKLAKILKMSENTVSRIKRDLEEKHHLMKYGKIMCPLRLVDEGYLDIDPETGLKGLQLLLYGLLKDRGTRLHGTVDTWAIRLAELMGLGKDDKGRKAIHNLLAILHKKGFVERLDDGRLRIK